MFIYTLSHPITNEVRYIGFTSRSSLDKRLKEHLKDKRKTKRVSWIKSLLNKELKPVIEQLDSCNFDNWKQLEQYWIAQFRAWGFNLVNLTNGGEGAIGYKHTEKQKLNNSLRNKGKIISQETRDKISKNKKGIKHSEKTKKKLSQSHIGILNSEKTRKKISDGNRGKTVSVESRQKISKALKGKKKKFKERDGKKKAILQYDLNGNFIKEWESITIAANETNILHTSISNNLKNLSKTAGKFIWKYKN